MELRPLLVTAAILAAAAAMIDAAGPQDRPPAVVKSVDLKRYAGTWYEIARFPNRFQNQCAGEVIATYTLRPDGRIDVVNRCRKRDGTIEDAAGIARLAGDDASGARLKVRFAPAFLSFLPFVWGDYWILGLGAEYDWALVGDPGRDYLWILARTPTVVDTVYRQAVTIARDNGFDVSRLVKTPQSGGAPGR